MIKKKFLKLMVSWGEGMVMEFRMDVYTFLH